VSRTRCSARALFREKPGPTITMGPGSAAHRHSVSKTRVDALMALRRIRGTHPAKIPLDSIWPARGDLPVVPLCRTHFRL
jgi:hypothetical protein